MIYAPARCLPYLGRTCSARTQRLSQIDKLALEMRETDSLGVFPLLLPYPWRWMLRHSVAATRGTVTAIDPSPVVISVCVPYGSNGWYGNQTSG